MSRFPVALFAVAVICACDAGRSTAVPAGGAATADRDGRVVAGAGNFARPFSTGHFTVSAHSDASGGDVHGNASIVADQDSPFLDFDIQGPVTCLAISGNRAAVGIKAASGTWGGSDITGFGIILLIEDNGPPGKGTPDGVTNSGFYADGDNIPCADGLAMTPFPNKSGNVVIK